MSNQLDVADNTAVAELASLSNRTPSHGGFKWAGQAGSALLEIQNKFGEVVGVGALKDDALRSARRALLGALPVHYQTLDEFRGNALVLPAAGPADPVVMTELHRELTDLYYRSPEIHTQEIRPKQWVENGIKSLLNESLAGGVRTTAIPGGKFLIVAHASTAASDVVRTVHSAEVQDAILSGKMVPSVVMENYPELLDLAISLALHEDAETEVDMAEITQDMESRLS